MRRESLVGQDGSRPVVVKKESKCGGRERPFRCPEREGGEKRDREDSCSRGRDYQSERIPTVTHSIAVSDT